MITRFKVTARSSNRKTGPIATTMSSSDTCPATCPFNHGNGCYASGGPAAINWRKLDRGETGAAGWIGLADQVREAKIVPGTLLRHNVAGDLPHVDGQILGPVVDKIRGEFLDAGTVPFTYTHHRHTEQNLNIVAKNNRQGFTVNLSCDSEAVASDMHRQGFPSVCVVPDDDNRKHWTDQHGTRFLTCPAQIKDGMTCDRCRLCSRADRACVVVFRAHGNRKRKVSDRLRDAVGL